MSGHSDPPAHAVQSALASAQAGTGAAVLWSGPSGSGLSWALARAAESAVDLDMTLVHARGRTAERPLAFGVTAELFAPLADGAGEPLRTGACAPAIALLEGTDRAPVADDGGLAVIRAMWTLAREASSPLAVVVDDLHDVDAPTLRLLAYGAARLRDWPVVILAAHRTDVAPAEPAALQAVADAATGVTLAPLDAVAAVALVRAHLPEASTALCAACAAAAGARPGLLDALAADLAAGDAPTAEIHAGRLTAQIGPRVTAAVARRMSRLPAGALALARAVAAQDAPGEAVAAGLQRGAAPAAIDALVAAGVVVDALPLTFAAPLERAAIRASLTNAQHARLSAAMPTDATAETPSRGAVVRLGAFASLTPSEDRVAELAARGMTTREVAAALFVTPKTVEFHLRNVYRKLEIPSSRAALTRTLASLPRGAMPVAGEPGPASPLLPAS